MNEQTQTPRERAAGGGGGLGGVFDDGLGDDGLVTVSSGPYAEQLPVANMTVGEIRGRFRDRFDIDPRSQAVLAGNEVGDETVVRPGQLLMFVRRAGEKGSRSADRRVRLRIAAGDEGGPLDQPPPHPALSPDGGEGGQKQGEGIRFLV